MSTRALVIASAVFAAVVIVFAVLFVRHQQEHQREVQAARDRFAQLDAARSALAKTLSRMYGDHNKIDAAQSTATKASQTRHDQSASLSTQQIYDLAHTERKRVEDMEAAETDLATQDESLIEQFEALYGSQAVSGLRRDMASLNQARENGAAMWWRAAENIEDGTKDELNGGSGSGVSADEIVQEYDESSRDDNTAQGLEHITDSEVSVLLKRLASDFQNAKTHLKSLTG